MLKSEDGVNWETVEQTKEQEERSKRQSLIDTSVGKTLFEQLQERKDTAQAAFDVQKRMHFGTNCILRCITEFIARALASESIQCVITPMQPLLKSLMKARSRS